ncbi:MAG: nucleoside-diphosphate kinase [Candidatus Micrarchaeales archaeon]
MERTLVIVKPDGVEKGATGAIIAMFEKSGLKITALRMLIASKEQVETHYLLDKEWYEGMWKRTKDALGDKVTETAFEMGVRVRNGLVKYLASAPIVAMVVEGNDAIATVRKLAGATSPDRAEKGTIRATFSNDSYAKADGEKRAIKNVVHASDAVATAEREISVWFTKKEIVEYKRMS